MANDVNVRVGADSSALATGLNRAQNSVRQFGTAALASVTKLQAGFAGLMAVLAVFSGIKGLVDFTGQLNDLADRLNETPEAMQRLGYAAEQNGADLETVVKSLQKAGQAAVDAAKGNETATAAFDTLGISAADFAAMNTEDKLKALADGFNGAENSTLAFDAVLQLAGKSGGELIPLLLQGGDGIAEAFNKATVASDESVKSLDAVGDRFGAIFSSLKAWGVEALGFLIEQVDTLSVGIAALMGFFSELPNGLEAAKQGFNDAIDAAVKLQEEEERAAADRSEKRRATAQIDPEQFKDDSAERAKKDEEEKKAAEDLEKEKAKLRESIAQKSADAEYDALNKHQQEAFLMSEIDKEGMLSGDDVEGLKAQERKLDLEEKLKAVRKSIADEDKKIADEAKKDSVEEAKKGLDKGEDDLSKLERGSMSSIDSLRSVGGGVSGVNYDAVSKRDALQQQAVTLAKEQVDYLKRAVALLQEANSSTDLGDSSFS